MPCSAQQGRSAARLRPSGHMACVRLPATGSLRGCAPPRGWLRRGDDNRSGDARARDGSAERARFRQQLGSFFRGNALALSDRLRRVVRTGRGDAGQRRELISCRVHARLGRRLRCSSASASSTLRRPRPNARRTRPEALRRGGDRCRIARTRRRSARRKSNDSNSTACCC